MDERQADRDHDERLAKDMVAGLLAEIALMRKELEWIGETTHDPEIKFKVASILRRSLEMPPPQEND